MKSSRKRPDSHPHERNAACWCGNEDLKHFSDDYLRCARCETLVLRQMPTKDITRVRDDSADLYGRNYYLKHLQEDFGYPDLKTRARTDLPERCLHWLRTTLKYKTPPGKALELGSAHGAFVALLQWTGFRAKGLELSPWVVNFAKGVFDVPILSGPIEDQRLAPQSLDVIALMDVLEHLPSPVPTMERCLRLLKKDGVLIIQTPRYPEGGSYEDMVARHDPFLEQLKSSDHLYLYSQKSVQKLLQQLGAGHVAFEPAIFAHYDMFLVASPSALSITPCEKIETVLGATPASRLIQALLDTDDRSRNLQERLGVADADRAARLEVIQQQGRRTTELEGEVHRWLEETKKYSAQALQSESLRAGLNEQASRLIEENKQAIIRLNGLQAELQQERSKSEALTHEKQDRQAAFAVEKLDFLRQLEKVRQSLATVEADRARISGELEQERSKGETLTKEKIEILGQLEKFRQSLVAVETDRARISGELEQERTRNEALTREKLDLLGQLKAAEQKLATGEAKRSRLTTDLATSASHVARLQVELAREKHTNESLTGDLQAAQEKIRVLTTRLDAQSRALDGTVKSLEAARARLRELQEELSKIEEHALVRLLKACHLGPS